MRWGTTDTRYAVAMSLILAAFVAVMFWVWLEHRDCEARECDDGLEALRLSGACVCVARPKP